MTQDGGTEREPTRRELRAARRRAHDLEKERRHEQSRGGKGRKGDKKGKGGRQPGTDEQRHRH